MPETRILIVDDEPKIRTLLRRVLEADGYAISEADGMVSARESIAEITPDLITLDLQLGHDNGLDIAREIRQRFDIPIVMVTAKDDVIDRIVGLEIGADDYITKPFHVREVTARIKSILRRTQTQPIADPSPDTDLQIETTSVTVVFDELTAVPDQFRLIGRDGKCIELTSGEFRLLQVFLDRPKRVLSREQLMDLTVGGIYAPLDRTIDNQVARLRKKTERDPTNPTLITTVRGIGYALSVDVRRITG